ncbi:short transient receptor potential channel 5-like [Glandiceps talaboti]
MAEEARIMLEEMYLSAAEKGEKKAILIILEHADLFDVNCTDSEGRTALLVALENRHLDVMEILLSEKRVQLGDTLLRAVNLQFTPGVVVICKHLRERNDLPAGLVNRCQNDDFHPDMTAAVLASQHNNFEILKILIEFGATIEDPDHIDFFTEEFTLEHSVGRINVYRALTSEACLCLTNVDPLEAAFRLGRKMRTLSEREFEFRAQYQEMAENCEEFASQLMNYVRNSEEQNVVLTHDPKEWSRAGFRGDFKEPFKVKTSIKYDQKKFVAHPHCQQRLVERWYHGLPNWRRLSPLQKFLFSLLVIMCFPFISMCFIISPNVRPGKYLNTPFIRFLCHIASQLLFLLMLVAQFATLDDVESESGDPDDPDDETKVRLMPSPYEWVMVLFLIALTWKELSFLLNKGFAAFSENLQSKLFDTVTLALYWGWVFCQVIAIWQVILHSSPMESPEMFRNDFNTTYTSTESQESITSIDTLVEDIMPITNYTTNNSTFGVLRKVEIIFEREDQLQDELLTILRSRFGEGGDSAHRVRRAPARLNVGGQSKRLNVDLYKDANVTLSKLPATHPLLIGEALLAVAKVFSFMGVVRMTVVHLHVGPMQISFGRMGGDIVKFLVLFVLILVAFAVGMSELYHSYTKDLHRDCLLRNDNRCVIPYKDFQASLVSLFWTLFGMTPLESVQVDVASHWVTEFVGYFLFAIYHVIAIIALLNILIAMMSNTYTRIEDDADIQWKFSRSTLWMSYYEEAASLSPPFNLIPSWRTIKNVYAFKVLRGKGARKRKKSMKVKTKDKEYKELMQQLVQRFIFDKKGDEDSSAQETWMLQLKQDVSGFKYDMFETLGSLSKTMSNIHKSVDENAPEEEGHIGSEFLKAVEGVVQEAENVGLPIRPDTFTTLGPNTAQDLAFADDEHVKDTDDEDYDEDEDQL